MFRQCARTRCRRPFSQGEVLELIKAHPKVDKNLVGTENFAQVETSYKLKNCGNDLVADRDGSLAYLAACRLLCVPALPRFISQLHDEFVLMRHVPVGPRYTPLTTLPSQHSPHNTPLTTLPSQHSPPKSVHRPILSHVHIHHSNKSIGYQIG